MTFQVTFKNQYSIAAPIVSVDAHFFDVGNGININEHTSKNANIILSIGFHIVPIIKLKAGLDCTFHLTFSIVARFKDTIRLVLIDSQPLYKTTPPFQSMP